MNKEEALKISEKFATPEDMFMDGCAGISDEDIIVIAENCQQLLSRRKICPDVYKREPGCVFTRRLIFIEEKENESI